ncbi:PREDICTED: uncharacterized protein LOC109192432 [Ipomoea nil]|uniref:uncharacterized protein LOC109192432 n=1 Tax=Ipomoea nil TaxID=35883 RepID=UPI000901EE12|nr:PREDICTED: uncharacterized protein LOC109192432 [Ipomoea nil]XP_019198617.1 PREDICTED: uncharacterized protein LOC109192432 [Ipomoea nil]
MHIIKGAWSMPTIALATCKDSRGKKTRIRRSKEERKSMVETFIKTYQKSNDGNFPSLRLTHKEVGGSFYTVREIVREIIQENRVLGPSKLNSEEQTDQIFLEQHPLGSLCTESHPSLSSTGEIHVITGTIGNDVLDSSSHFHGADNSLDNGKTVSARSGRSKGNEGCEEPADFIHDYNGNIQEQLLHSNREFPVSYDQKFHNGETFDKDENSSKSGTVNNSSLHQQDATGLMSVQVDVTLVGPVSEGNTDVAKRETLLESGESSLQISTSSSNEIASDTESKADDSSAIIKTSNDSTNSSQTTLVAEEESLAINNPPSVQRNSIHQKGHNPPVSRPNPETRKPNKPETNPLLALFKAFVTAFVKFWTEE